MYIVKWLWVLQMLCNFPGREYLLLPSPVIADDISNSMFSYPYVAHCVQQRFFGDSMARTAAILRSLLYVGVRALQLGFSYDCPLALAT